MKARIASIGVLAAVALAGCGGPGEREIGDALVERNLCRGPVQVTVGAVERAGDLAEVQATIRCEGRVLVDALGVQCQNLLGCWGYQRVTDECRLVFRRGSKWALASARCGRIGNDGW